MVNLPSRASAPSFDFHFIVDGDYMDVYYSTDPNGSDKTFSASFALVDYEMRRQIREIIGTDLEFHQNPFDPSRLTFWPRRTDCSMDFPHHPLTVPQNSGPVFVFENTVVRVEPFEAPAENQPEETADTMDAAAGEDNETHGTQSGNGTGFLPSLVSVVGVGFAIVAAGGVALVARRKKQRNAGNQKSRKMKRECPATASKGQDRARSVGWT